MPQLLLIDQIKKHAIANERIELLHAIAERIASLISGGKGVNLQFVCTHNSRRSQFSQIWAHAFCHYFNLHTVYCFSAGTEATALFPKVAEILEQQGMRVSKLSHDNNPFYLIKPFSDSQSLFCFSKTLSHPVCPETNLLALMTCAEADAACPMVPGAIARFPLRYKDPKFADNTPQMDDVYLECSNYIACELFELFGHVATLMGKERMP